MPTAGVLHLQRTAGNAATTRLLANPVHDPEPLAVQRLVERGAGWGWPMWVTNGFAFWTGDKKAPGLDPLFNTALPTLIEDLKEKQKQFPLVAGDLGHSLAPLIAFRDTYDGSKIAFEAQEKGQTKSAEAILLELTKLVRAGRSAAGQAEGTNKSREKAQARQQRTSDTSLTGWIESLTELKGTATDSGFDRSGLATLLKDLQKRQSQSALLDDDTIGTLGESVSTLKSSFASSAAAKAERERRAAQVGSWRIKVNGLSTSIGDFPLGGDTAEIVRQVRALAGSYAAAPEPNTVRTAVEKLLGALRQTQNLRQAAVGRGWSPDQWGALVLLAPGPDVLGHAVGSRPVAEFLTITGNAAAVIGWTVAEMVASKAAWQSAISRHRYIKEGENVRMLTPIYAAGTPALSFHHLQTYRATIDRTGTSKYSFGYSRKYTMSLGTIRTTWELHIHFKRDKSGSEGASYVHFTTIDGGRTNPVAADKEMAPVLATLPKVAGKDRSVLAQATTHFA